MTTYPRPLHLPPLPVPPHSQNWAANINQAYTILSDAYDAASQLLRLEDGDPIIFRLHADRLVNRMAPILHELVPLGVKVGPHHIERSNWRNEPFGSRMTSGTA